jgi:queuine tRNA-ribosyltransferase
MAQFNFQITAQCPRTSARTGTLSTPHGEINTPVFMPVGTRGSVKGIAPQMLASVGTTILLANTYHLALRPSPDVVAALGGLHRFMAWPGPILTDSGGFQVFSLATLVSLDDQGVTFKSHIDGAPMRLDPATAIDIQQKLGADIIMSFDQCPALPATREQLELAVHRTLRWAAEGKRAHSRTDQALFGIIQGGLDLDLRLSCLDDLVKLDFPGYAIGGLSVGEHPDLMAGFLRQFAHRMPQDRPRYLMGVGRPIDLVRAVASGIDMFDCVMPTRNGRNSFAFRDDGVLRLRNAKYKTDLAPLDPDCSCYTCKHFSRGYLRHLFLADEMLGPILVSLHNIAYYHRWMERIRSAITAGALEKLLAQCEAAQIVTNEDPE